jgi:hypothetical protein
LGARGAAVECAVRFDPVTDHFALAMGADWCELMYGALKRIERVFIARRYDVE